MQHVINQHLIELAAGKHQKEEKITLKERRNNILFALSWIVGGSIKETKEALYNILGKKKEEEEEPEYIKYWKKALVKHIVPDDIKKKQHHIDANTEPRHTS